MGVSAPPEPPDFLSKAEAARRLSVSRNTINRRLADGTLPSVAFGHRVLIPRAAIDVMVAAAMAGASNAGGPT